MSVGEPPFVQLQRKDGVSVPVSIECRALQVLENWGLVGVVSSALAQLGHKKTGRNRKDSRPLLYTKRLPSRYF